MSDIWQPAGFTPDRALQRDLLSRMQQVYPDRLETIEGVDWPVLVSHLHYLEEHGLCDVGNALSSGVPSPGGQHILVARGGRRRAAASWRQREAIRRKIAIRR